MKLVTWAVTSGSSKHPSRYRTKQTDAMVNIGVNKQIFSLVASTMSPWGKGGG
jgi:hypothetical protein